jgi:hypothetical protein
MSWRLLLFLLGMAMLMVCSSDQAASDDLPLQATASPVPHAEPATPEPGVVIPPGVSDTIVQTQVVPISASPTIAPIASPIATVAATSVDRPGRIAYVSSDAEIFTSDPDGSNA